MKAPKVGGGVRQVWDRLRYAPGDWWFMYISRKPVARAMRAARRRLEADVANWQPQTSEQLMRWLRGHTTDDPTGRR